MKQRTAIQSTATPRNVLLGAAALAAAGTALWVHAKARQAERNHPPAGRFLEVDGVRVHCVDRGEGPAVLLVHGNVVSSADFEASGLIDLVSPGHRVIAVDRPGFGYSERPRDRLWTPDAQARLLAGVLDQLGVAQAVVLGHSMGTLSALALALNHPEKVRKLVLVGGYYYPQLRLDALLTAPVALPLLGDLMRYTVTALSARAMLRRVAKKMFQPRAVPAGFFPTLSREMMLRPMQLRANAEDAAFMQPAAAALSARYPELRLPVTIMAGADDEVVDPEAHSARLHRDLPYSQLLVQPGAGHMVHYAAPEMLAAALTATT